MELKNFISSTIEEISRGILEASENLSDTNAIVSPKDFKINSKESQALGRTKPEHIPDHVEKGTRVVQKIDFDIAVTVDETDKTKAGGKISVLSIGLGGDLETSSKTGTNSRIKFSVPIVLPSKET
ncbi:trypco2 family protein [Paraglaciecola hydrolytica]|uniref:Uncharacterized protein n=1 Tax=Paraglaciecola hydrolytica TaxID=1799789 RepID=A0A136A5E1_9ALTE|nr:trypco2 family protein [Paraglaciecola hydrolytica]KXI30439.1 hypothetical protein AX660_10770 [Paraglaciecola hydrolytica]